MNWPASLLHPVHRSPPATLSKALTWQLLTGLWLEGDCLSLCISEKVITAHLNDHGFEAGGRRRKDDPWITFTGWLKITQDAVRVILEVGALYTAHIYVRKVRGRWTIVFQGGRDLAA